MANFQQKVVIFAIIILIFILVIISYMLTTSKYNIVWPPNISNCPDYWIDGGEGICVNKYSLGNPGTVQNMDFSNTPYIGPNGACNKYKWANQNGLSWDALTYGVQNPCDSNQSKLTNYDIITKLASFSNWRFWILFVILLAFAIMAIRKYKSE